MDDDMPEQATKYKIDLILIDGTRFTLAEPIGLPAMLALVETLMDPASNGPALLSVIRLPD